MEGFFPYYLHPHREWGRLLDDVPGPVVHIYIPWGVHERERGVIDIARSSRLCLERLINLIQKKQKRATITFGFLDSQSIPGWAWAIENSYIIPRAALVKESPPFCAIDIPALADPQFSEGFKSFIGEALGLLRLYEKPEGPIDSIRIDMGFYESAVSLPNNEILEQFLKQQYSDVAQFNAIFRIAFKSISGDQFRGSLASLIERRPWVVCSNIQRANSAFLKYWLADLDLERTTEIPRVVDGIRVEDETSFVVGGAALPYCPDAVLRPAIVQTFNKAWQSVRAYRQTFGRTDEWASVQIALVNKFIRTQQYQELLVEVAEGITLIFLPTLPVYDEYMEVLRPPGSSESIRFGGATLKRFSVGKGSLLVPAGSAPPHFPANFKPV